ncbi:MAG: endonuclease III [Rubricoccaceae bacterium]
MTRREKTRLVLNRLRERIPRAETELAFRNPFELLVAVVLSAQCTDKRVNMVTPALFEAYPTPEAMARAEPEDLFPLIRSVSYPNNKAKALAGLARRLVEDFGGEVPRAHADLVSLPGVGRKTANVVVSVAFDEPALAVDTHVFRVANRIGLVREASTPRAVEEKLARVIPKAEWGEAHHLLILHGRYTCLARAPRCEACPLPDVCDHAAALARLPAPRAGLDAARGRYYCATNRRYFDDPVTVTDRQGVEQLAEPRSGSTLVFDTRTGRTTRRARDYRI